MNINYSNLVYLHDILESIIEHNPVLVSLLLQNEGITIGNNIVFTNKEQQLPNGRRIDVIYVTADGLCIGFEIKSGNGITEDQIKEELEGMKKLSHCTDSRVVVVSHFEPNISVDRVYYIPLSSFIPKIKEVIGLINRYVKEM
mgnify:CR=1 FL=1